jgi:hypothetical protein
MLMNRAFAGSLYLMIVRNLLLLIISLFSPVNIIAVEVHPNDFTAAAQIEGYEDLDLGVPITPLMIGDDVYSTMSGRARYPLDGKIVGRSGFAFGTFEELDWVDIELGIPAVRAGMYVGLNAPWTIEVSFFDVDDALLGTIQRSGLSGEGKFAGWQSDAKRIGRVRVTDLVTNGFIIVFDDFIQEVPEPHSLSLALLVSVSFVFMRYRRVS